MESGIERIVEKDEKGRVTKEVFVDEIRKTKLISLFYEYGADGKIKKEVHADGFGNMVEIVYWYNEKRKYCAFRETEIHKGQRVYTFFKESFYDEKGRTVKENNVYPAFEFTRTYEYDKNGNLLKSVRSDVFDEVVWEYDILGNILIETEYDPDEKVHRRIRHTYNDSGQIILKEDISDTAVHEIHEYFYSDEGFRVKETTQYHSENNGLVYFVEHNFLTDSKGKVIFSSGKSSDFDKTAYFYNEAGKLVITDLFCEKEDRYFLERNINFGHESDAFGTFVYEYDLSGNCLSVDIQKLDGT